MAVIETSFIILFCLNCIILYWLMRLEKIQCNCALTWQRQLLVFYVILSIFMMVCILYGMRGSRDFFYMELVFTLFGAFSVIVSLHYIYMLRTNRCICSEHVGREILYILSILKGFVWGALILFVSILIIASIVYVRSRLLR